jgi:hypothetical protein
VATSTPKDLCDLSALLTVGVPGSDAGTDHHAERGSYWNGDRIAV